MPAVATAVAAIASAAVTGGSIVGAIVKAVVMGALSFLSKALTPKPKQPSFGQELTDRTVTARQPISPRRTIYGRARVGGIYTYITTTDGNDILHMVVTLSGHEVDEIEKLFFDGQVVPLDATGRPLDPQSATTTTGSKGTVQPFDKDTDIPNGEIINYSNFLNVYFRHGEDDQTAFQELIDATAGLDDDQKWTADHRQRGCACVYLRLDYHSDIYPNGIPDISFLVRGKNDVYDPRTSSYGWTDNAALVLADYLATPEPRGIGAVYGDEISLPDLIEAANICDELVVKSADSPAATEVRYATNGAFEEERASNLIPQLASAMAGAVVLQGTTFILRAGAYRAPTASFDENDIIEGVQISTLRSRSNSFNSVRGVFAAPENGYQPSDFPAVQVDEYVTADGGEEVFNDIELNYTTSGTMAQRIARILLEEERRQITATLTLKSVGYRIRPYDTISLSLDRYGWSNKTFRVLSVELNPAVAWSVVVDLVEIDASIYAVTAGDLQPIVPAPTSSLPSAFSVPAPAIATTDFLVALNSGTPGTTLRVTLTPPGSSFVSEFEVQYRRTGASSWQLAGRGSHDVYDISNVEDGVTYDVRAQSISVLGVKSGFVTVSHLVVGATERPANVAEFGIQIAGSNALLAWGAVDDLDLSHYQIRYSPKTTGATWSGSALLVNQVAKPATSKAVPALVGTYLIKAVDLGGRESLEPALIVSTVAGLEGLNAVETREEHPEWSGERTNATIVDGALELEQDADWFDGNDIFDHDDIFQSDAPFHSTGEYLFADTVDLGAVYTSRVTADFEVYAKDYSADFFNTVDVFDQADWFGDVGSDWNARLFVRTTDDDPASSPVNWSEWTEVVATDITARAFQFKIEMSTGSALVTPVVARAGVSIDMPDRTQADQNINVSASGLTISFPDAFRGVKAIAISAQDLQTGDYYVITNKTADGFDIAFKNSSDVGVSRTFDYVAVGYGKAA